MKRSNKKGKKGVKKVVECFLADNLAKPSAKDTEHQSPLYMGLIQEDENLTSL